MGSVMQQPGRAGWASAMWLALGMIWLLCLPSSAAPAASVTTAARTDFAFAEPYFDTLGQGKSPATIITALAQDAQGWLWIGTQVGLFRYDGYRMRKFAHDDADPASLAGDFVTALWVAPDGRLWVGTHSDGVSIFDPQREQFSHLRHDPARPASLAAGRVWALSGDGKGAVWIGTNDGLDYVTAGGAPSGGAPLQHYRHEPDNPASLLDNRIFSLLRDAQGTLWVGSAGGLQRYQAAGPGRAAGFVALASDPANPTSLAGQEVRALFQAQDGKLWIGTRKHGAAWLNLREATPPVHWLARTLQAGERPAHAWVHNIIEAQDGQIWLASDGGGIDIVAAQDGTMLQHVRHDPANASSLAHDTIVPLLRDQSGVLWLGSWGGGLQRYHPAQQAFHVLRHSPARPAGLSHPDVRSVLELADGRILLGTAGNGIDIWDRRMGLVGGYRAQAGQPAQSGDLLSDGKIEALAQTPDGVLWAGTQQAGVFRLASGSSHWQGFGTGAGLPSLQVRKFLVTNKGVLWVATASGIAYWQAETGRFVAQQQQDGRVLRVDVQAIAEDRQGRLWAAGDNGLWLKPAQATRWQVIRNRPGQHGSILGTDIRGLLVDANDRLWVATAKGLVRLQSLDADTAVFDPVAARAGKPGQYLGGNIWQDRAGHIWLCRDDLVRLDPQKLVFAHNAGPDLGTVWVGSYGATRDGLLLYGGAQGLAIFDPARFRPWHYQPEIRISELKIHGAAVAPASWQPRLRLLPGQRSFSVEFAALDFSQEAPRRYRYRLHGYDPDWVNTDGEHRLASYGNLWPGHYRLQVQGSNSEGEWSSKHLSLPIEILPAFWQTPWFFGLMLLLLASAIGGGYRWRLARMQRQGRALQRKVAQRTAEALAAHREAVEAQHATLAVQNELALARQLEQTREQMLQQEKMAVLGTLTAGVAHEINNPTHFTHVAAQIQRAELARFEQFLLDLMGSEPDPEVVAAFKQRFAVLEANIATMLEGTGRIQTIVKDLRAFSRREHEQKRTLPVSECLMSTLNLVRSNWAAQVEFITDFAFDPPYECWPSLLNQVLMNLMVNGCHAIAEKRRQAGEGSAPGHLWLRLRKQERDGQHWLVIEIEDDGCGMEPQVRERILEPFFTTKDGDSGTGLGLSIAHGIIQKHGGTLEVASTPGQGSCFSVHLPLNLSPDLPPILPLNR
jgi:signal transduction histidine kinase/ligand-binding sensor domain-containing protein